MATPPERRVEIRADAARWKLLGDLLAIRRKRELGYKFRPAFNEATGINTRRVSDIEKNIRPNTHPPESLMELARGYQVTYESVLAVLDGEADELVPAEPATAEGPQPGGPAFPLMMDRDREKAVRPLYAAILKRLLGDEDEPGLAEQLRIPVDEVTGAQLFGAGTPDAKDWDDERTRRLFSVRERVWMIAEMRVREGSHNQSEAGSALAAPMMNVMAGP